MSTRRETLVARAKRSGMKPRSTRHGNPDLIRGHLTCSSMRDGTYRIKYAGSPTDFTVARNDNEPERSSIRWCLHHDDIAYPVDQQGARGCCLDEVALRIANYRDPRAQL